MLDHALISVSGEGSGNIFISGGQFFANDSTIQADTEGADDGGVTDIQAETLSLERSRIFSDTYGTGKGGDIMLRVAESVSISDFSKIFADATGEDSDQPVRKRIPESVIRPVRRQGKRNASFRLALSLRRLRG